MMLLAAIAMTALLFVQTQQHIAEPVDYLTWCGDCVGIDYTTGSPWVVNPSTCMWDSDDNYKYASEGSVLRSGATASVNECRYASNTLTPTLPTVIDVMSPSPDLLVAEKWSWAGGAVLQHVPAVADGRKYLYRTCAISPQPIDVPLVTIPNSHGGMAVPQQITVSVTNPTARTVRKTGGIIEAGLIPWIQAGCA